MICDTESTGVPVFPREGDTSVEHALMCFPEAMELERLHAAGIRAVLRLPFDAECEFLCESRTPRDPGFERHAAAELFAQLFAMQLEIDRLRSR
jgi:hypothetical protein